MFEFLLMRKTGGTSKRHVIVVVLLELSLLLWHSLHLENYAMTDSAINTPTAMSEDEDDNDNDNDNMERDEKLNEEYLFKIFLSQTARSGVSDRPEKEGTQEEKAAMAEFTRTHRIKNLFETADDYATTFAAATMVILKIEFGMKGKRTRYVRKVWMLGTGCLATP